MFEEFGATIDDVKPNKGNSPKFRKTEYLSLTPGEHKIRILEPMETKTYTHYVGWSYLKCLGDDCPLCENNKKIMYEHPEDYNTVKGWTPRRARFSINVFDKTPTKVCPKEGKEHPADAFNCSVCGTALPEAAPLNKVKVLSSGKDLFEDLKIQSKSIRDEQDERIDIRKYDFLLTVVGVGRDREIHTTPRWFPGKENFEEIGDQQLFDLENATITVNREEMLDVFNGASIKDVFTLRRAKKELEKDDFLKGDKNVEKEIGDAVDEIFKS